MKFERQAECPFCGQIILVTCDREDDAGEILSNKAVMKCDCRQAELHRGIKNTEAAIAGVLGEGGAKALRRYGFRGHHSGCAGNMQADPDGKYRPHDHNHPMRRCA